MFCRFWLPCLIGLLAVLSGCNNSKPASTTTSTESTDDAAAKAKQTSGAKPIFSVRRDATSYDGHWVLLVTNKTEGGMIEDRFIRIFEFLKNEDGKFTGKLIDSITPGSELVECVIEDKSVFLKLRDQQVEFDFKGELDGFVIRGTISNGVYDPVLARLLPTDGTKLSDYAASAFPPAIEAYRQAGQQMQNRPQIDVIVQLMRQYPTSPISFEAATGLMQMQMQQQVGLNDDLLKALFHEYLTVAKVWGPRMLLHAKLRCIQQLVTTARMPDEALKHLEEAEKLVTDNVEFWKARIQAFRQEAEIQRSLVKSRSQSEQERAEADAELQEALKLQPFNPEILFALAEYAKSQKQVDSAIEYFSTLAALPLLEQFVLAKRAGQPAGDPKPFEILTKLWSERHGGAETLEPHLKSILKQRIDALRAGIRERAPQPLSNDVGDHTVLVEFFTGAMMPPSVAPEIALDTLSETYSNTKLITLRYHQHIPGPDGLANQDSEDCLASYDSARVPMIALDGMRIEPSGYLPQVEAVYATLRGMVESRIRQSGSTRIDLDARVVEGELSIQAAVSGAPEDLLPSLRLRLAIVEEDVEAPSPIGILHHAMVVREMPGGAKGIAPKKGELKYSYTMPITEVQKHLDEYLNRFQSGKGIQFPEAMRPAIRNQLYLVGWAQNDKVDEKRPELGRVVIQAAIVPIVGTGISKEPVAAPTPETKAAPESSATIPPPPALAE